MEVFIRDEDKKWDISYDLASQNNSLDCKDHKPIIPKSLDQHDAEVRAEERKKVVTQANYKYICAKCAREINKHARMNEFVVKQEIKDCKKV